LFHKQTQDLDDAVDQTWIVSGQSPDQKKLIESHPSDQPIYVEGAFRVWISRVCINYFILRAEPKPIPKSTKDVDGNLFALRFMYLIEVYEIVLSVVPRDGGV